MSDIEFVKRLLEEKARVDELGREIERNGGQIAEWARKMSEYESLKDEYERDMESLSRNRRLSGLKDARAMRRFLERRGRSWAIFWASGKPFGLAKGTFATREEAQRWLSHCDLGGLCQVREVGGND